MASDETGGPEIVRRTYELGRRVGRLTNHLLHELRKEQDLARQLQRAARAVGAMTEEGQGAESRRDFIHKFSVAYKEARETHYWLRQLKDSGVIHTDRIHELTDEARQVKLVLYAIVRSAKEGNDPPGGDH